MRMPTLLAAMLLLATFPAFAGHFAPDGKFEGTVGAGVQNAINAFARTHDAGRLRATIVKLVERDPGLVDDAIHAGASLPADGQVEIAKALAAAYADLAAKDPKSAGLASIKAALTFAPQPIQTAFTTETNQLLGVASVAGGNGGAANGASGSGGVGGGFGGGVNASSTTAPAASVSPN